MAASRPPSAVTCGCKLSLNASELSSVWTPKTVLERMTWPSDQPLRTAADGRSIRKDSMFNSCAGQPLQSHVAGPCWFTCAAY